MALHGPYHDSSMADCHWGAHRSLDLTPAPIDIHLAGIVVIRLTLPKDGVGVLHRHRFGHLVADECFVGHRGVDIRFVGHRGVDISFVGHLGVDVCFADLRVVRLDWRNILAQYSVDNYCHLVNTHSDQKPTYVRSHAEVEEIQNSRI